MTAIAPSPVDDPTQIMAAVDLGSNSFHMVVSRLQQGQFAILDRLREMVRLAAGLSEYGYLDSASQERALDCLKRFGQRLRDMQAHQVRVVGTSTLRRAQNADAFLAAAEEALGHPVEVISGMEEARLIYLGVSHNIDRAPGPTLVVDVGGGSTELIIGEGHEPQRLQSLGLGCVGISEEFFDDGRISQRRFDRARMAVQLELRSVATTFQRLGWSRALGSSGTVKTAGEVARQLGLAHRGVTAQALDAIVQRMIKARRVDALKLPGLGSERAPVFPGGIAILIEVLSSLGIDQIDISEGALREGLLYDMLGRLHDEDARERTIRAMQRRYHVDEEQGARVEDTAESLLTQVQQRWGLEDGRYRRLLKWAAQLHEVGLDIAHSKYHQHGGYLLANSDMLGFGRLEQQLLATLVAAHRRKLDVSALEKLPPGWRVPMFQLIVLLRLAVLLNRGRAPFDLPKLSIVTGNNLLELRFPGDWLDANPLTHADLTQEQSWLETRGFELRLAEIEPRQALSES